jgi:CHAT domain-containing protein/tetratricopeptide (TPR) repeat protein
VNVQALRTFGALLATAFIAATPAPTSTPSPATIDCGNWYQPFPMPTPADAQHVDELNVMTHDYMTAGSAVPARIAAAQAGLAKARLYGSAYYTAEFEADLASQERQDQSVDAVTPARDAVSLFQKNGYASSNDGWWPLSVLADIAAARHDVSGERAARQALLDYYKARDDAPSEIADYYNLSRLDRELGNTQLSARDDADNQLAQAAEKRVNDAVVNANTSEPLAAFARIVDVAIAAHDVTSARQEIFTGTMTMDQQIRLSMTEQLLRIDQAIGDSLAQMYDLTSIAQAEASLGQDDAALVSGEQAAKLLAHREVLLPRLYYTEQIILAQNDDLVAVDDEQRGNYAQAVRAWNDATAIDAALGRTNMQARELAHLAALENDTGDFAKATQIAQSASQLNEKLGDAACAERELTVQAGALTALGEYQPALTLLTSALRQALSLGDEQGGALVGSVLGHLAEALGADGLATTGYINATRSTDNEVVANANDRLAVLAVAANQVPVAAQRLAAAQTAAENERSTASWLANPNAPRPPFINPGLFVDSAARPQLARTEAIYADRLDEMNDEARGQVFQEAGNPRESAAGYTAGIALAQTYGRRSNEAADQRGLSFADEALGDYAGGLTAAHSALGIDQQLSVPLWADYHAAALNEEHLDRQDAALADYDRAVTEIGSARSQLNATLRASFLTTALAVYDDYVRYLVELDQRYPGRGYGVKALEIFEERAARSFLEDVADSLALHFSHVPAALTTKLHAVQLDAQTVAAQQASISAVAPQSPRLAQLTKRQQDDAAQYDAIQQQLEAYPAYRAIIHPAAFDAAALQYFRSTVLKSSEAVLVYDVLPQTSVLWQITKDRFETLTLGGSDVIRKAVQQYAPGSCTGGGPAIADELAASPRALQDVATATRMPCARAAWSLFQLLVPPPAVQAIAGKTLFVVPSGVLYGVPFEALVTADPVMPPPHYLIEDHAVAYISSASLLRVLRNEWASHTSSNGLFAVANPDYQESAQAINESLRARTTLAQVPRGAENGAFPSLPGSEAEARAAFAALGLQPQSQDFLDGTRATTSAIFAASTSGELARYRYVLFGMHAVLSNEVRGVTQPSLVLSKPLSTDDFLTMGEVFGMNLQAQSVVLSACNSGRGTTIAGEGVQGLTQAFMFSGARTVVVSDWAVLDAVQAQLTPAYFAALQKGRTPVEALRAAKLALIKSGDPLSEHPYAWAPMVLFGDGNAHP